VPSTDRSVVIRRALLSVSDKQDLIPFARFLSEHQVEILATGGTYRLLKEHQIPVVEISDYTGFPEMMEGRVKTLHPKIHGGILARRGIDDEVMEQHQIRPIDLVVVNLYPFSQTIEKGDATLALAIENIDIGGPTMIRASAKNFESVAVVVDPRDYHDLMQMLRQKNFSLTQLYRFQLAKKAFTHTALYDSAVAEYLGAIELDSAKTVDAIEQAVIPSLSDFSASLHLNLTQQETLRYGENPHQKAALYTFKKQPAHTLVSATFEQGKTLSYNNLMDADAAWECVCQFETPACVIVKHANPCGVAKSHDALSAYLKAYETDPVSAFGGIIAFNIEIDETCAIKMIHNQFIEVVVAPHITPAAISVFKNKPNIRVLTTGGLLKLENTIDYRPINGGMLVQTKDTHRINACDLRVVTRRAPSSSEKQDLLFAWSVAQFVKSNAIVYAKDERTIGVGAGQMSRVHSAKIAQIKGEEAGLSIEGSAMASDAFFPFRDSIDAARAAGITAIIQPGGSMRDQEVIDAADEGNIAMVFTGIRHFRH